MSLKFTRIVADENVPKEVVEMLKTLDFKEVYWVSEHRPGITDPQVWSLAAQKGAILLTGDLGFMAQLTRDEFVNGPNVVEYYTDGFSKSELQDPAIMAWLIEWLFKHEHHRDKEHTRLFLKGTGRERLHSWNEVMRARQR